MFLALVGDRRSCTPHNIVLRGLDEWQFCRRWSIAPIRLTEFLSVLNGASKIIAAWT
jgi:hypothetical protein